MTTPRRRGGGRLRGTASPNAKLDDDKVRAIRARRAGGASLAAIAADFAVSEKTIERIVARQSWRHVI